MKKTLSMVLAIILVLSFNFTAFASPLSDENLPSGFRRISEFEEKKYENEKSIVISGNEFEKHFNDVMNTEPEHSHPTLRHNGRWSYIWVGFREKCYGGTGSGTHIVQYRQKNCGYAGTSQYCGYSEFTGQVRIIQCKGYC